MKKRSAFALALLAILGSCGEKEAAKPQAAPPKKASPRSISPISMKAWTPPVAMPEPREILKGDEWTKRWSAAKDKVNVKAWEKDGCPAFALGLSQVVTGMQADLAGVKVGDRVTGFEGKPALGVEAFSARRGNRAGRLQLWSDQRGSYEIQCKEGRIGITYSPEWFPTLAYLRSAERDEKWDEYVSGAAANYRTDSDLAETALYHAFRAGYRGWMLAALLAQIAYQNGRPVDCMNFGWFAKATMPEDQKLVVLTAFFHSAIQAGQLDWAVKIDEEWPAYHVGPPGWQGSRDLARWKELGAEEREELSPCTVAASGRSAPQPTQSLEFNSNKILGFFSGSKPAAFNMSPPQDFTSAFGPALRNVDFVIDLEVKPFEPRLEGHDPRVVFKLVSVGDGIEEPLVGLNWNAAGSASPWGADLPFFWVSGSSLFGRTRHRVELAVRGRQCELRLNDQCLYLGSVEDAPSRRVVCMIWLANVIGQITDVEATPLDAPAERPAAGAPRIAPGNPEPRIPPKPADAGLAWHYHALVEGYLANGRRNPAWDQAALDGLTLFCPYLRNESDRTSLAECARLLGKAVDAGCDDPLILYAAALSRSYVDFDTYACARQIRRAADLIRSSKYSPALRCFILAAAGIQWGRPVTDESRRKNEGFEQNAVDLLAEALDEENVPGSLMLDAMLNIGKNHPEGLRDPLCGFDRVSLEAAKSKKGSAAFLAYKGSFYVDHAWRARGGGWANTVTDEKWKQFHHRLEVAAQAFEQSWKEDRTNPRVPARMLSVALGHEKTRKDLVVWVDRALNASPDNSNAILNLLWFLAPRWHGSDREVLRTGREFFERAKKNNLHPEMALLLLKAHEQTVMPGSFQSLKPDEEKWYADELWRRAAVWKEVQEVFSWILEKHPESAYYRSLYAAYAGHAERWSIAKEQFGILGDRLVPAAFKDAAEARRMKALAAAGD